MYMLYIIKLNETSQQYYVSIKYIGMDTYNFEAVYCHDVIRTQSKNHFIANVQHATIKVLWDICKKENLWKQKSNKSFHNILIILKFLYDSERTTKTQ